MTKQKKIVWVESFRQAVIWYNTGVWQSPQTHFFILLFWNRLELWRRLLWLFQNICGLKNAEERFQISPLVFPIWRLVLGLKTKMTAGCSAERPDKRDIPWTRRRCSTFAVSSRFMPDGMHLKMENVDVAIRRRKLRRLRRRRRRAHLSYVTWRDDGPSVAAARPAVRPIFISGRSLRVGVLAIN